VRNVGSFLCVITFFFQSRQREKINEELNTSLTGTIDKLLAEQEDRLQLHVSERTQFLNEKSRLSQELERTKTLLEDSLMEKVYCSSGNFHGGFGHSSILIACLGSYGGKIERAESGCGRFQFYPPSLE
jgi:hypothetical protein